MARPRTIKRVKLIQKLIFATLSVVALVYFALGRREAAIVGAAVALTPDGDVVCLVGVGLYAQSRVAVRTDFLHWDSGG